MSRFSERALTSLIVLVGVPVHLIGLFSPSIYRDPAGRFLAGSGRPSERVVAAR